MVKLGHETSITFEVDKIQNTLNNITVTNTSFKNITRNQSAFIVFKEGFDKNQFILDSTNDHTATLKVENLRFEIVAPAMIASGFPRSLIVGGILVFTLLFMLYRLLSTNKSVS